MSETVLNSVPGTSTCKCQMVQHDGRWRPQVRFDAEGVDWFSITWDEDDLAAHIGNLQLLLDSVKAANKGNEP